MGVIQRVVKPRNQKSKRALEAREPKPVENAKSAIFVRGPKSSDMVMRAMRDIHALKKPNVAPEFYGKSKYLKKLLVFALLTLNLVPFK